MRSSQVENFASPRKLSMVLKTVDEDFLGDVFRLLPVANHPVDQAEDLVAVGADDLAERLLVALLQAGNQEPLGEAHLVGGPLRARTRARRESVASTPIQTPEPPNVPVHSWGCVWEAGTKTRMLTPTKVTRGLAWSTNMSCRMPPSRAAISETRDAPAEP